MPKLDFDRVVQIPIPAGTGWLLGACMEAKGKQDLWLRQKPEVIEALREQAMIQSAESSNRIEGVTVAAARLQPIVLGGARPRDRSEEELAGYRKALEWIFSRKSPITLSPQIVLHLHALAQGGASADAGQWKRKDNEIVEIMPNGERRIRFVPLSARETPGAVERLCASYMEACEKPEAPLLLLVATFVFDLLCIHPFRDGNGRVSRLATTLLLREHGFDVARYVSLERLIEERKDDYYRVLEECSNGWHEGRNEMVPWWSFFLSIVRGAYVELARKVESAEARPAKSDLIRKAVLSWVGPFTLSDVHAQFPAASLQLVKKVLSEMKRSGRVRLVGRGRGARWETTVSPPARHPTAKRVSGIR